jgi:hypothetical protein
MRRLFRQLPGHNAPDCRRLKGIQQAFFFQKGIKT